MMDLFSTDEDGHHIFTVSELTGEIKSILETSLPALWVQGEISNFTHHSSGHMYFSLKDERAQISCTMWRSRNESLLFTPQDGMKVLAFGSIRVYEKRGNYQLDVIRMMPAGVGELQLAFEQLKERLFREGLFEQEHKKPIPAYPERIGIVTSPTGAAIRDIVNVVRRRFPLVELILRPVRVQGEGAAEEIARAIEEMNEYGKVDVMIVGRGGGSLEDLWAFNEEVVARAIYRSRIPIVSAVGHEIDFTIADFVADLRAPTPSAASEMVVPEKTDVLRTLRSYRSRANQSVMNVIENYRQRLKNIASSYGFRRPPDMLYQYRQRLDELIRVTTMTVAHRLAMQKARINHIEQRLLSLAPDSILRRGYSICWRESDKKILTFARDVAEQDKIGVHFYKGGIEAEVKNVHIRQSFSEIFRDRNGERNRGSK